VVVPQSVASAVSPATGRNAASAAHTAAMQLMVLFM
jgi:hypothetical protein